MQKNGYEILFSNWTHHWAEIDLVAKLDSKLIFVEVKTMFSDDKGYCHEKVNYFKLKKLERSINLFLLNEKVDYKSLRLDVICVLKTKAGIKIKHFKGVSF